MMYRFGAFRLDTASCELSRDGQRVAVEPQVFALLQLLIENRHRVVGKEELVARIWQGRCISDAAISSRIKSARQSVDDNGHDQLLIRTAHGQGFRFVAEIDCAAASVASAPRQALLSEARPSVAVLRFADLGTPSVIAEALPFELIGALARLRQLFVIARGSSFRFAPDVVPESVGAGLGVHYVISGSVEVSGRSMIVLIELNDALRGGIIWAERFGAAVEAIHAIRTSIVEAVVNAMEVRIPFHEAMHAARTPECLDAWGAYHLGVSQMYRFCREGNALAMRYFRQAVDMEPDFARAYAGLSFASFGDAFLRISDDAGKSMEAARHFAEEGMARDPLDPFCNLVMAAPSGWRATLKPAFRG